MERLGNYRIIRRLGAGAMGEVYLGEHTLLRVSRALKVLPESLAGSAEFRERFLQEGQLLASLKHDHIVQVYDMGIENTAYYIAMDFVSPDGKQSQSLDELIVERGGRVPPDEVAKLLIQVCEAMAYAHDKGLIHRDIKPSNILLAADGQIKVSDFGLAKIAGGDFIKKSIAASMKGGNVVDESLGAEATLGKKRSSAAESLVGTFHYMPPEVQNHGEWTKQGDIYSLGVLTYLLLVGRRPVGRWKKPSLVVPGIGNEWNEVIERLLEVNPQDRFQSASELSNTLQRVALAIQQRFDSDLAVKKSKVQQRKADESRIQRELDAEAQKRFQAAEARIADKAEVQRKKEEVLKQSEAGEQNTGEQRRKEEKLRFWEAKKQAQRDRDRLTTDRPQKATSQFKVFLLLVLMVVLTIVVVVIHCIQSKGASVKQIDRGSVVLETSNQNDATTAVKCKALEFVEIPTGSFIMGGKEKYEGPLHRVTFSKGFLLGKYEVTQSQWQAVMGNNPSKFKGDDLPVENVSWNDSQKFIQKLNALGKGTFRLPSEAEWEYACRAGSTGEYGFGNSASKLSEYAWYKDNSGGRTHPVGQKKPNAWGLYDMHGNVWEWCQDCWHKNYDGAPSDGRSWESLNTSNCLDRGGGWQINDIYCRSAFRDDIAPSLTQGIIGFRLVRNP